MYAFISERKKNRRLQKHNALLIQNYLASIRIPSTYLALNIMHICLFHYFSNYRGMVDSDRILCLSGAPLSVRQDGFPLGASNISALQLHILS